MGSCIFTGMPESEAMGVKEEIICNYDNMHDMISRSQSTLAGLKIEKALNMLKSTGTKEELIKSANDYADSSGMDQANRNLLITLKTEGKESFIKKAFQDPNNPERVLSYSEMREKYG